MKSQPDVSILVPIYNVEKYLRQCLDSILKQTLNNIEIILLNDGSTDSSPSIIREYAAKDDRIVVLDKENTGYGDTMNRGIAMAHGRYIGIVESDDWIEPNMYSALLHLADTNDSDIAKSNFYYYYSNVTPTSKQWRNDYGSIWNNDLHQVITQQDTASNAIPENIDDKSSCIKPYSRDGKWLFSLPPSIWSAIYRTNFIRDNGISFLPTPGASYQDTGFAYKSMLMAERVALTNKSYLHYRQDNESSSIRDVSKVLCVVNEFKEIESFAKKKVDYDICQKHLFNRIKFGSYYWNLQRLPYDRAKEFLLVMSDEFRKADKKLEINWLDFDPTITRRLQEIIYNPNMFLERMKAYSRANVSVIVPVYNTEKYIRRCLQSLIVQSLTNIEIIIIDDESPDLAIKIAEEYWQKDPRIQIVHRKNGGLSAARNTGLYVMHAPYVMFCDSDDTFEPNACEELWSSAKKNKVDIAVSCMNVIYESNYNLKYSDLAYYATHRPDGVYAIDDDLILETDSSVCNKIFSRRLVRKYNLHFPDGLNYEDFFFSRSALLLTDKVAVINRCLYNYYRHSNSIMANTFARTPKALDHTTMFIALFDDYIKKYNLLPNHIDEFINDFRGVFRNSKELSPDSCSGQLYTRWFWFVKQNQEYLDNISPDITHEIISQLPKAYRQNLQSTPPTHAHKLARIAKLLKSLLPSYRFKNQIISEIEELKQSIDNTNC